MPFLVPPIVYDNPTSYPRGTERSQPHPVDRSTNRWAEHFNRRVARARGRSILKENGVYVTVDTPDANRVKAAEAYYAGGHVHEIDAATGDALTAAGFTVYELSPGAMVHGEAVVPTGINPPAVVVTESALILLTEMGIPLTTEGV